MNREETLKHLYKSDRDTDGTPNCGEADYYYIQAYNDGLRDAEEVVRERLQAEREKVALLREALEYYKYTSLHELIDNDQGEVSNVWVSGKLARQALEKLKEAEGRMNDKDILKNMNISCKSINECNQREKRQ